MNAKPLFALCFVLLNSSFVASLHAQGTAFTYQGRLNNGTNPANGVYDLRFTLFQYDTGGNAVLGPITNTAVTVSNGLFTTLLDFGPYDAEAYGRGNWLEISVRTNGTGALTVLSPRQQMTPAPRATYAAYASSPVPGSGFNADALDGLDSTAFWQLGGNAGTTAGTHFLGTTDNQALELKVNNARGLRIEPTAVGVNFIAGNANNSIANDSVVSAIGGGQLNIIETSAFGSTIAGGDINTIRAGSPESVISGGIQNIIGTNSLRSVIAGGLFNRIGSNAIYSVISGGRQNRITNDSQYATISGGWSNLIETASSYATVSGGNNNVIGGFSPMATVGGGTFNQIGFDSSSAVISGGTGNYITNFGEFGTIAGGSENGLVETYGCAISGGIQNRINGVGVGVRFGSIIGGALNLIGSDGLNVVGTYCPTVLGGAYNWANSDIATAAGYRAKAVNPGSFVWADHTEADFYSSSSNQFLIRASGGVGIGVNAPQQQLSVAAGVNIDQNNFNDGTTANALTFGSGSGEGIGSKRTPGGDQYGLDFYSNFAKRMSILNNGNVGIGTDAPSQKLHVIGNILASGTITPNSDRNQKTDFAAVDVAAVLHEVTHLPIQQWRFKSEPEDVKHFGPMAQDFRAAFGLGEIPTAIATVDADGVALAAIQGLNEKVEGRSQKSEARIQKLEAENGELKQRLEKLEQLLDQRLNGGAK